MCGIAVVAVSSCPTGRARANCHVSRGARVSTLGIPSHITASANGTGTGTGTRTSRLRCYSKPWLPNSSGFPATHLSSKTYQPTTLLVCKRPSKDMPFWDSLHPSLTVTQLSTWCFCSVHVSIGVYLLSSSCSG